MAYGYQYVPQTEPKQAPTLSPVQEISAMLAEAQRFTFASLLVDIGSPVPNASHCGQCARRAQVRSQETDRDADNR